LQGLLQGVLQGLQQQWGDGERGDHHGAGLRAHVMTWLRRRALRRGCVAYLDERCRLHLHHRGYASALLDQPGRMEAAAAAVRQVAAAGGWRVEERSAASHPTDEGAVRQLLRYAHSPRYIERQLQAPPPSPLHLSLSLRVSPCLSLFAISRHISPYLAMSRQVLTALSSAEPRPASVGAPSAGYHPGPASVAAPCQATQQQQQQRQQQRQQRRQVVAAFEHRGAAAAAAGAGAAAGAAGAAAAAVSAAPAAAAAAAAVPGGGDCGGVSFTGLVLRLHSDPSLSDAVKAQVTVLADLTLN